MQESVVIENNAEPADARWYLSRDGEQHGPLSDRELSMFAEGGNFQPGDLLWTEGLDEWMSADAVFGLAENDDVEAFADERSTEDVVPNALDNVTPPEGAVSPTQDLAGKAEFAETDAGREAPVRHTGGLEDDHHFDETTSANVGALAKALRGESKPAKLSFLAQLIADLRAFSGLCAYLWIIFAVLTLHAVVSGAQFGMGLSFFVLSTVNALLLMRAWPLIEGLRFFQNLQHKPLIYAMAFKTLIFGVGLVLAYAVEMGILSLVGFGLGYLSAVGGLGGVLAWLLTMSLALFPYFVFREVEDAIGPDMMRKLLFRSH